MTREEFQKTVSERFTNTDNGFGNMTQRELILLQIASNVYDGAVKNCSIPVVSKRFSIGEKVMWGDLDYWVMEDNGDEKVLIANCEKISDPDYNDWWVRRTVLNAC